MSRFSVDFSRTSLRGANGGNLQIRMFRQKKNKALADSACGSENT
jgi:hypothetical protein